MCAVAGGGGAAPAPAQDAPAPASAPMLPPAAPAKPGQAEEAPEVPAVAPVAPNNPRGAMRARSEERTSWQLDVTPGPMRLYVDPSTGTPYWYFTYKTVNNTGRDLRFAPKFELVDDEGRITVSGQGVPSDVSRRLLQRLNDPLVEDQNQILGDILQGEENAKEGIVVFEVTRLASKELFLYVSNLSSERRIVRDAKGEPAEVRRQFRMAFRVSGDAVPRGSEALELVDEGKEPNPSWVWR